MNVDWAVRYWLSNGAPSNKLVLGLATYGHSFKLANSNKNNVSDVSVGPGNAGKVILKEEIFILLFIYDNELNLSGLVKMVLLVIMKYALYCKKDGQEFMIANS